MQDSTPEDDPELREALKRCSPATYYAACKFRQAGRREDLRAVVYGVFERFVERELRPKVSDAGESLRLREDLGIDSLTMMEVVMIAEEVLRITVSNDELTKLHTLGEVQEFILAKVRNGAASASDVIVGSGMRVPPLSFDPAGQDARSFMRDTPRGAPPQEHPVRAPSGALDARGS